MLDDTAARIPSATERKRKTPRQDLLSDKEILKELLKGEHSHFSLLVQRTQPGILHYASPFFDDPSDARTCVRDILQNVFKHLYKLKRNSLFSSYLLGVLKKELRNAGRTLKGRKVSPFWKSLSKISRVQREVLLLFFQGYAIEEIALIREESKGLTRSRLVKGIKTAAAKINLFENGGPDEPGAGDAVFRHKEVAQDPASPCPGTDQICLFHTGALPPEKRRPLADHLEKCRTCADYSAAISGLLNNLREEAAPFLYAPEVLRRPPAPSALWALLGAAAIVLVTALLFFLCKGHFKDKVTVLDHEPQKTLQEEPRQP